MTEAVQVAIEAARAAGRIQQERIGKLGEVRDTGAAGDFVTEVDLLCEKEIIRRIKNNFSTHGFLAEETGGSEGTSSSKWIIDPLDGTLNYSHGYPCYCVSIALESGGELAVGVVYNPCLDELFVAEKGKGATLNGKAISVSSIGSLPQSLLVTGFTPKILGTRDNNLDHFCDFMQACQAVRRPGSAALDLCYTAVGRFEGFWEIGLHPWDMAAGTLIVLEAGGTVSQFDGSPFTVYDKEILATNSKVHPSMIDILQKN